MEAGEMLHTVAKCAILVSLAVVGASAARAADSCNLSLLYDFGPPEEMLDDPRIVISSGKEAQCTPVDLLKMSPDCEMWADPQHGGSWFGCKSGPDTTARPRLSGQWGVRSREFFQGPLSFPDGLSTQHLPKHQPARETWLAPVDVEGWDVQTGVPPYGYGTDEYWRAKERNYIDYYPRTFTKIGPVVRSDHPPFRLATQTLFYTTMSGKERAAVTGEAALGYLKIHFVTWAAPQDAQESERYLTAFLQALRLEPAQLTRKQRDWICCPGGCLP
jgi:hypothetical protein